MVLRTQLAMSLVNGMVASTLFAMPKPVDQEVSLHMVALEKFFDNQRTEFGTSLFALWFGFPFADGQVKGVSVFDGCFEQG